MKKKIFLKESNLRQIISNILEQVEDNDQYYKISADELYDIFGKYGTIRQIRKGVAGK